MHKGKASHSLSKQVLEYLAPTFQSRYFHCTEVNYFQCQPVKFPGRRNIIKYSTFIKMWNFYCLSSFSKSDERNSGDSGGEVECFLTFMYWALTLCQDLHYLLHIGYSISSLNFLLNWEYYQPILQMRK